MVSGPRRLFLASGLRVGQVGDVLRLDDVLVLAERVVELDELVSETAFHVPCEPVMLCPVAQPLDEDPEPPQRQVAAPILVYRVAWRVLAAQVRLQLLRPATVVEEL